MQLHGIALRRRSSLHRPELPASTALIVTARLLERREWMEVPF